MTILLTGGPPVFQAHHAPAWWSRATGLEIRQAKAALDFSRKRLDTVCRAGDRPVPPDDYVVVGSVGRLAVEVQFTIKAGERATVDVVLNAGSASLTAEDANQIDVVKSAQGLDGNQERVEPFYGPTGEVTLPADDYVAVAYAGEVTTETAFAVKPAERTEVMIKAAVGAVAVAAPGAASIEIVAGKAALDGSRGRFHTDYNDLAEALLPPGDYLAIATRDYGTAEGAFTVTDGERTESTIALVVGQAVVMTEGASSLEILEARGDLNGARKRLHTEFHTDYDGTADVMLPPVDYVALGYFGEAPPVVVPFAITNGERSEVSVPAP